MEKYENMNSSSGSIEFTSASASALKKELLTFENFLPTLSQCYFIVLAGYFSGSIGIFKVSDLRGVTSFAALFSMPAIICVSLADADILNIEWQLLAGILIGKAIIYGLVLGSTLFITRPPDIALAAMFAMFCVQCNDLPVGNPLMSSLYKDDRPYMLKYLFCMPASTIIVFSPVTHVMMQYSTPERSQMQQKRNCEDNSDSRKCPQMSSKSRSLFFHQMMRDIILDLMKNPVIIATFMGVMLNISFDAHVPSVLHRPVNVVAGIIPGLALAVLGFSMVGKERHLFTVGLLPAFVLVAVKMVLTPLVLFLSVRALVGDEHKEMLDFSLLYGIIAPAAVVFQIGEQYRLPVAAMGAALILSSFSCFPLSYVVAKLSFIQDCDLNSYIPTLGTILVYVAAVSMLCCMLVWVSFVWKKEWKKPPCCYILILVLTQVLMATGIVLWQVSDNSHRWTLRGQFTLACGGEICVYIWTATLSVVLVLQQTCPSVLGNKLTLLLISSYGPSCLVIGVLYVTMFNVGSDDVLIYGQPRYNFQYHQLTIITAVLIICLIVIGVCFVIYMRRKGSVGDFTGSFPVPLVAQAEESATYTINLENAASHDTEKHLSTNGTGTTIAAFNEEDEKALYYEEIIKTSHWEKSFVFGHEWSSRFISLLMILWTIMIIKFLANVCKLSGCQIIAITVPLEYLQAILFTGQGLWTFLTFGVDVRTACISLKKRWRKLRYGEEGLKTVTFEENEDLKKTCDQFRTFFFKHCLLELAKERIWKKNYYRDSFWGHQMVTWLVKADLAEDELEAEEYGEKLLQGGIIRHVRNAHHFADAPYLYYFVKSNQPTETR